MTIFINERPVKLPSCIMTIRQMIEWKMPRHNGTVVAVNDRILREEIWENQLLKEGDRVAILSICPI